MTRAHQVLAIYQIGHQDGAAEQSRKDRAALAEVMVEARFPVRTIAHLVREMERRAAE